MSSVIAYCPKCGGSAKILSGANLARGHDERSFQCQAPSCGARFAGVLAPQRSASILFSTNKMSNQIMDVKCIAVDLDGTLAKTTRDGTIGEPILQMADRVKKWHDDGLSVVIFSARADSRQSVDLIKSWLKSNSMPDLQVTNIKDASMVEIWDNRAIRVEADTGEVCRSCNSWRKSTKSISSKYSRVTDC